MLPTRILIVSLTLLASPAAGAQHVTPSVEEGARIAIIGGCHDCHTAGYAQSGQVDPAVALLGDAVGYRGPWGTTYPANLRLLADGMSDDDFVTYFGTLETLPPMPWFNLHAMTEDEVRSLYMYIASLGEPGEPVPEHVPPDMEPDTPFINMLPVLP